MRNRRHRTGDIGEAAFVLKATQLGLQVAKPMSGKEGYDYITHNGHTAHRVQIKTNNPVFLGQADFCDCILCGMLVTHKGERGARYVLGSDRGLVHPLCSRHDGR